MPRRPRLELPGVPMHLTHRGVNRAPVFVDPDDFRSYREALQQCLHAQRVSLHAYVLMTNHVHLLVTTDTTGAISRAMCKLGQRYVPRFNRKHDRTGTLWEGRFRSCLVDSEGYLLRVYRYIELNPVRAAMARSAEDYPWSSVHANLGLRQDPMVTPHPVFSAFAGRRRDEYRHWLQEGCSDAELRAVRAHVRQERALGDPPFQERIARILKRPVDCRGPGRPRREELRTDA